MYKGYKQNTTFLCKHSLAVRDDAKLLGDRIGDDKVALEHDPHVVSWKHRVYKYEKTTSTAPEPDHTYAILFLIYFSSSKERGRAPQDGCRALL